MTEKTNMKKNYERNILVPALSGAVGGALIYGFIVGFTALLPSKKPVSFIKEVAMVDTGKILHDRAASLAEQNYTKDEIYKDQIDFIRYLDDAMNAISEEKQAVLIKPEAAASFRLPDYTQEVIRRIKLQESRLRREKK